MGPDRSMRYRLVTITELLIHFTERKAYIYIHIIISLECRNWAFRKAPRSNDTNTALITHSKLIIGSWERPASWCVCVCLFYQDGHLQRISTFFWLILMPACIPLNILLEEEEKKTLRIGTMLLCVRDVRDVRDNIMDADWWWHLVLLHIAESESECYTYICLRIYYYL